jgi:hypothetical protein
MFFLRVVSVLCGTAILFAFAADVAIYILTERFGGIGVAVRKGMPAWFPSPFTIIFSALWIVALIVGLLIVKKFGIFPYGL